MGAQYNGVDSHAASIYVPDDSDVPSGAQVAPGHEANRNSIIHLINRKGLYRLHKQDKASNEPANEVALANLKEWAGNAFNISEKYQVLALTGANQPNVGDLVEISISGNVMTQTVTGTPVGIMRLLCGEGADPPPFVNEPGALVHSPASSVLTTQYRPFSFRIVHTMAATAELRAVLLGRLDATETNRKIALLEGWRLEWRIWRSQT